MPDAARPRPVEFYNPRPLILSVCFLWGVAMGFCIFYFSPPEERPARVEVATDGSATPAPEPGRRLPELPNVASIPDIPEALRNNKVRIEDFEIVPPQAVLTTEGGITGRTAKAPGANPIRPGEPSRGPAISPMAPPIPELMP